MLHQSYDLLRTFSACAIPPNVRNLNIATVSRLFADCLDRMISFPGTMAEETILLTYIYDTPSPSIAFVLGVQTIYKDFSFKGLTCTTLLEE